MEQEFRAPAMFLIRFLLPGNLTVCLITLLAVSDADFIYGIKQQRVCVRRSSINAYLMPLLFPGIARYAAVNFDRANFSALMQIRTVMRLEVLHRKRALYAKRRAYTLAGSDGILRNDFFRN